MSPCSHSQESWGLGSTAWGLMEAVLGLPAAAVFLAARVLGALGNLGALEEIGVQPEGGPLVVVEGKDHRRPVALVPSQDLRSAPQ